MKVLKVISILALVLFLTAVAGTIYFFSSAKVEVVSILSNGEKLEESRLEELIQAVQNETFMGTLYQTPSEWKTAEDYIFLNYTVRLKNNCLVPLDRVELQVVPLSSDILQLGDLTLRSLEEKSEEDFGATILAAKNTHSVREIIVTYYVWGVSFSIRATAGQ